MSKRLFSFVLIAGFLLVGCGGGDEGEGRLNFEPQGREVPDFDADTAYHYVQRQLELGPRNPGSPGHKAALNMLVSRLESFAGDGAVYTQQFTGEGYEGEKLELSNIIASFNLRASDRVMLCAHWDTRPRAERADTLRDQPIPGADDGASGTAVLLELARIFSRHTPPIGVDIVLFDGEDYGKSGDLDHYFLGSRHWSNNPPVVGYSPRFGILLDMVGGKGARFPKEGYSMRYAPALVNEIWSIAEQKGYSDIFIPQQGDYISDDHVIINRNLGIPTVDIIRHEPSEGDRVQFADYWHTHDDDLSIISKKTMKAVGEVLTELIYNRIQ